MDHMKEVSFLIEVIGYRPYEEVNVTKGNKI